MIPTVEFDTAKWWQDAYEREVHEYGQLRQQVKTLTDSLDHEKQRAMSLLQELAEARRERDAARRFARDAGEMARKAQQWAKAWKACARHLHIRCYRSKLVHWAEATMASLSGQAIELAKQYVHIIEQIERGGYTHLEATELDETRQNLHDELIHELQRCNITGIGVDFDGRANARELAKRVDRWIRE